MIRSLFLPDMIGSYHLFTSRYVGIEINKTHITAVMVEKSGFSAQVKHIVDEPIEQDHLSSYQERATQALMQLLQKIGKFDSLYTILPSSLVFFKEIQLPFTDREKISLIIGFEVEPLLPFPLHEAVIDFVITDQKTDSSTLLVAAVQKKVIEEHVEIFTHTGIQKPDVITVDFLILYDLFIHNNVYHPPGQSILADFGSTTIRLGYIDKNQLRQIRTIMQGTTSVARAMAEQLHINPAQAMEHLLRFGIHPDDHPDYVPAVHDALAMACQAMQLTIRAFTSDQTDQKITLFLLGSGARIPGIDTFLTQQLNRPCTIIDPAKLVAQTNLSFKTNMLLTTSATVCIGAITSSSDVHRFNLAKDEFEPSHERLLLWHLITGTILFVTFFIILGGYAFVHLRSLHTDVMQAKNETVDLLRDQFPTTIDPTVTDLDEAVSLAQRTIEEQEKTWAKFSAEERLSPIKYLLALATAVNKDATGLDLEQLTLNDHTMALKGKVNDFDALKLFKQEIRQEPLFKIMQPEPNLPDFSIKIKLANPEQKK